jgi:hypothetical protein
MSMQLKVQERDAALVARVSGLPEPGELDVVARQLRRLATSLGPMVVDLTDAYLVAGEELASFTTSLDVAGEVDLQLVCSRPRTRTVLRRSAPGLYDRLHPTVESALAATSTS